MIALYSINLRIMGRPNVALITEPTVLTPFEALLPGLWLRPLVVLVALALALFLVARFLLSEAGLAMRSWASTRAWPRRRACRSPRMICAGMMLSNALVALAGALFAQLNGFADVTIGTGTIVVGLAAVIVGETLVPSAGCGRRRARPVPVGSIVYRLAVALALEADMLGLQASDLNLITALLVGAALVLPAGRGRLRAMLRTRAAGA